MSPTVHASHLWSLLQASRSVIEIFISTLPDHLYHFVFVEFTKVCYAFAVLSKLIFLRAPYWDLAIVWRAADMERLTSQIKDCVETMLATDEIKDTEWNQSPWFNFYEMMGSMLGWLRRRRTQAHEGRDAHKELAPHFQDPASIAGVADLRQINQQDANQSGYNHPVTDHDFSSGLHAETEHDIFDDLLWQSVLNDFTFPSSF
jgi:hypothetical protein